MQLINIDKVRYRKHLNIVIVSFIATLLVLALIFAQLLIISFGQEEVNNFRYNLLGVVLSLLACMAALHTLRTSDYFKEIYYVWQIKQIQNLIYRKLKKVKKAAKDSNEEALIILTFYYKSQQQVYQLDDNTLTISKVNKALTDLEEVIDNKDLTINVDQFDKKMITSFK